ncbi:hypothetical protein QVD17_21581 [Tagetes erecta]|uniref:Uncharacterized protein n=1 Tax=Tagetes erecta TaxID=13708 RepID=A0AAD8KIE9_TARER|nr:hypothetical protein QVD17_21581 [Tagetes erecta]
MKNSTKNGLYHETIEALNRNRPQRHFCSRQKPNQTKPIHSSFSLSFSIFHLPSNPVNKLSPFQIVVIVSSISYRKTHWLLFFYANDFAFNSSLPQTKSTQFSPFASNLSSNFNLLLCIYLCIVRKLQSVGFWIGG